MGFFTKKTTPQPDGRLERLEAEYLNYRRRTSRELDEAVQKGARQTAAAMLPLYDDLKRAADTSCGDESYKKGVELIYKELLEIFAARKIVPMDSLGKIFNPDYHEAMEHIRDDVHRAGEIVEVLQVGFTMDEEVLRHAKVVVANCE